MAEKDEKTPVFGVFGGDFMAKPRNCTDGVFSPNVSRFIDEYIACYGNGTLAYMRAYENDNQKTARAEAYELLKREDVQNEIAVRSAPYKKSMQEESDIIRKRLLDIIDGTDERASTADAIRAADVLNRMSARYINRVSDESDKQNAVNSLTDAQLIAMISEKP